MNQLVIKKPNGVTLLSLVLEPGNLHRLQQGDPIALRVHDLFINGVPNRLELMISYSDTPIADARELAKHADVTLDERTPVAKGKKPHCPECKSTIEQLGAWKNDSPIALAFCAVCGCVLGMTPSEALR